MGILNDLEAQRAIDDEIEHYKALIRRLSTRRNTYSAICQLPDEILSEIFLVANADAVEITDTLLSISSVCTRWREICLDTPQQWAAISYRQPLWLTEAVRRSKESPLTVNFSYREDDDVNLFWWPDRVESMASALVPEIHRFKDVKITCAHPSVDLLISSLLRPTCQSPTPLLRELKIGTGFQDEDNRPSMLETFWTSLTSLQSLELFGFLPVTAPHMPMLTNLSIATGVIGHCLSVPWLVNLLRNTPALEDITIRTVSSNFPISVTGALPVVLSNLRYLRLTLCHLRDSEIFSYLEIPPSTFCYVKFDNEGDPFDPETDISPLQRFISNRVPCTISSLSLIVDYNYGICRIKVLDSETRAILLYLNIPELPPPFWEPSVLVGSIPLEKVHSLTLETISDPLDWSNFLPNFVNLRSVQVEDIAILESIARYPSPNAQDHICNPKLEEIVVICNSHSDPDDWAQFIRTFITRQRLGKPVQRLEIQREIGTSMYHVDSLKRCTKSEMVRQCFDGHIYWDSEEFGADVEGFDEVPSDPDGVIRVEYSLCLYPP